MSQKGYDERNISCQATLNGHCLARLSGPPSHDPAVNPVRTDADEQCAVPRCPRHQGIRSPQIGQLGGLAYGAAVAMQDYGPAAPGLLIKLIHFKRDAGRLGQLREEPVGQSTEVDGALKHGVRDGQDLRKVSGLPCNATEVVGLDEIKALLAPYRFEVALRTILKTVIEVRPSGCGWADHWLRTSKVSRTGELGGPSSS
jgi:hypothetical protein